MNNIDAMNAKNLITFILNCIMGWSMFRKRSKAHRHILFILQNIERRDLIAIIFGPHKGVDVRWGDSFIFTWEKK